MKINLLEYIHTIKDFPKEGIYFKDIQPLLADTVAFKQAITENISNKHHARVNGIGFSQGLRTITTLPK